MPKKKSVKATRTRMRRPAAKKARPGSRSTAAGVGLDGARARPRRPAVRDRDPARLVLSRLTFEPATESRWPAIEELFGERGACGGCWCMAWRLQRRDWVAGKGAGNRRAFRDIVRSGEAPGVLALLNGRPIGWCAVAPREVYVSLERSRVLKPVDEQPVWSVSCLFVLTPYRRQGVSSRLLRAAVDFAASRGARVVEGYPVVPHSDAAPGPFLWTGTPRAFERAGFREVARRSQVRPIMRRTIRRSRAR